MKKKVILLAVLLVMAPLCLIVASGYYYGALSPVPITEEDIGPYTVVYLPHVGDYRESATPLYRIHRLLTEKYSLKPTLGFGIYYDNPAVTEPKEIRSDLGALFASPMDPTLLARLGADLKIRQWERSPCFVATFPFKNAASPMIGAIKVYPALAAYLKAKNFPMKPTMEIYEPDNGKILYVISKK